MSYIDQSLVAGERILYRARLHLVVFASPAAFFFLAFVTLRNPPLFGLFLLLAIISGAASYLKYVSSEFGLTDKRVVVKAGVITRRSFETLLSKIEGVAVAQGVLGRLLDYGTVVIVGTGGSSQSLNQINHPLEFRRRLQTQLAAPNTECPTLALPPASAECM